jgi:quercetin dioxygenase-like cupin family protein
MDPMRVISRDSIPRIQDVSHDGQVHNLGELRDFRWSDLLKEFMPDPAEFSVSWVRLLHGEVLEPHVHPIESMMIIYAGSGGMLGALERPIAQGDVIVVPIGSPHGFVGGPDGLYALSIQFGEGLYTSPDKPRVHFTSGDDLLDGLLAYNDLRLRDYVEGPLFRLFESGDPEHSRGRAVQVEALQFWFDGMQRLRHTSRATCTDPRYAAAFSADEKDAGSAPADSPGQRDGAIEAITAWFAYQMYVLDNAEKVALVHLVLANATTAYSKRATPSRKSAGDQGVTPQNVYGGTQRAGLVEALLRDESPRTYARLKEVIGEAWDMVAAVTDRLTELAATNRPTGSLASLSTSLPLSRSVGS